jgi:hypothetical protein
MGSFSTQRFEWWDLPLWRKAVIVGAAILFFVSGSMPFDKESNIYVSAPGQPNTATRQIYPVHVNHGYLRYVSKEEAESLAKWRSIGPALVAIALGTIGVTLFAFRGARS